MKINKWMLSCAMAASTVLSVVAAAPASNSSMPQDQKLEWFKDAHFGMFLHFGLYSSYGGFWKGEEKKLSHCAEWLMFAARANRFEYAKAAETFNPTNFDAKEWARTMKATGMKYMVVTTKHHEGFAMFATKVSKYNIVDATPYGKDIIGPLIAAARAEGIKIGLYYSQNLDWYHPGGRDNWHNKDTDFPDYDNDKKNFSWYVDNITIPQLKEILTKYGHIDLLWYDTSRDMPQEEGERIHQFVSKLSPDTMVNNRLSRWHKGDVETPEKTVPANGVPGKLWEACITLNDSWGYASNDKRWKSAPYLIKQLCDITSKGGNYLLNVGPQGDGAFPEAATKRLRKVGQWMDKNSEAIHDTRVTIFPSYPAWGRFTTKYGEKGSNKSNLYAIVFETPDSKELRIDGIRNKVVSASILDNGQKLEIAHHANTLIVKLPADRLGAKKTADGLPVAIGAESKFSFKTPISVLREVEKQVKAGQRLYVVKLNLVGETPSVDKRIYANADGNIELIPFTAKCTGNLRHKVQAILGHVITAPTEQLECWTNKEDTASYPIHVRDDGKYNLSFNYANINEAKGSTLRFTFKGKGAPVSVDYTFDKTSGSWGRFIKSNPVSLKLKGGDYSLVVSVVKKNGPAPCNLSNIYINKAK